VCAEGLFHFFIEFKGRYSRRRRSPQGLTAKNILDRAGFQRRKPGKPAKAGSKLKSKITFQGQKGSL